MLKTWFGLRSEPFLLALNNGKYQRRNPNRKVIDMATTMETSVNEILKEDIMPDVLVEADGKAVPTPK